MIYRRALLVAAAILLLAGAAQAASEGNIKHVLLISVDGLHALDVANYVQNHPNSALAQLSRTGVTYSNARTPANSDSFPGLMALVTGGSPITSGLFYDVSYSRDIFDPTNTTCSGGAGNTMVFDESIDLYNASECFVECDRPDEAAAASGERPVRGAVAASGDPDQHDF